MLSSAKANGSSCLDERKKTSWFNTTCGAAGKLWQLKNPT